MSHRLRDILPADTCASARCNQSPRAQHHFKSKCHGRLWAHHLLQSLKLLQSTLLLLVLLQHVLKGVCKLATLLLCFASAALQKLRLECQDGPHFSKHLANRSSLWGWCCNCLRTSSCTTRMLLAFRSRVGLAKVPLKLHSLPLNKMHLLFASVFAILFSPVHAPGASVCSSNGHAARLVPSC